MRDPPPAHAPAAGDSRVGSSYETRARVSGQPPMWARLTRSHTYVKTVPYAPPRYTPGGDGRQSSELWWLRHPPLYRVTTTGLVVKPAFQTLGRIACSIHGATSPVPLAATSNATRPAPGPLDRPHHTAMTVRAGCSRPPLLRGAASLGTSQRALSPPSLAGSLWHPVLAPSAGAKE